MARVGPLYFRTLGGIRKGTAGLASLLRANPFRAGETDGATEVDAGPAMVRFSFVRELVTTRGVFSGSGEWTSEEYTAYERLQITHYRKWDALVCQGPARLVPIASTYLGKASDFSATIGVPSFTPRSILVGMQGLGSTSILQIRIENYRSSGFSGTYIAEPLTSEASKSIVSGNDLEITAIRFAIGSGDADAVITLRAGGGIYVKAAEEQLSEVLEQLLAVIYGGETHG